MEFPICQELFLLTTENRIIQPCLETEELQGMGLRGGSRRSESSRNEGRTIEAGQLEVIVSAACYSIICRFLRYDIKALRIEMYFAGKSAERDSRVEKRRNDRPTKGLKQFQVTDELYLASFDCGYPPLPGLITKSFGLT